MYVMTMNIIMVSIVVLSIGMAKKVQKNLFGDFVPSENVVKTFVKIYEVVKEVGDTFTFLIDGASYNPEKHGGVLTLFDGNGTAVSIYAQHKEGMTGMPDGERFGRAMQRCLNQQIGSYEEIVKVLRDSQTTYELTVQMSEMDNGNKARAWSVKSVSAV